ncbi:MAG: hypothetical protein KatS3mg121_0754 [Gammaproteobacteria bacterium]|nr:MAG: hypothetical protein KatS3mg121_0754 [Gammaproteobacteria bacterium]
MDEKKHNGAAQDPLRFPGPFKVQWTETLHMLDLSAHQIDLSLSEGNESMNLLVDSFDVLAETLDRLYEALADDDPDPQRARACCAAAREAIHKVIIGMQFYDRLSQRLGHVRESLAVLADLIDDPDKQNIPEEWIILRRKIKTKYSVEQQKSIFHALMSGQDMDEVFESFEDGD